ncbi:MAG: VOC family protein [Verrucomicrobia bacterium]|nr:VOC family protein [Verrucomicrobiota bacterium]
MMTLLRRMGLGMSGLVVALAYLSWGGVAQAADTAKEFTKPTIDIGMFAQDPDRTAAFLTNAIGFRELPSFAVSAELGKKIGLVNNHPFVIRMFTLGEGEDATRLKVISIPKVEGQKPNQKFLESTYGLRYLTLYVTDMTRALERLKAEKVTLLGESPVDLGGGTLLVAFQDPDGNFIELIGKRK